MSKKLRLSAPALRVLKLFLENPRTRRSGAEISRIASVGAGTLYPLLARLEGAGWLTSDWERVAPEVSGRPRRRLYLITALGQSCAVKEVGEVQFTTGVLAWNS
jgi:PadR family transcriptional regulator PadR